ncbi:hypothetical protein P167DRAFT_129611 [Morchella conica CCBAS932]|uniref:Uncharacterized protein n=1 Tax=Morchella conica CCBAS932 TaxID=1392247 RepID=A0A3N4L6M8_9PEZI|nr:hypothetical protein P167DRAFT_129611 [Morchella conica CCBAS932]
MESKEENPRLPVCCLFLLGSLNSFPSPAGREPLAKPLSLHRPPTHTLNCDTRPPFIKRTTHATHRGRLCGVCGEVHTASSENKTHSLYIPKKLINNLVGERRASAIPVLSELTNKWISQRMSACCTEVGVGIRE